MKLLAMFNIEDKSGMQKDSKVVLRMKESYGTGKAVPEYITHIQGGEDKGYYWGHYFDNILAAVADFHERVKQNI